MPYNKRPRYDMQARLLTISVLALAVLASGDAFAQTSDVSISPPDNIVVEATGFLTPVDIGAANATSSSGLEPVITNSAPALFPMGDTLVHWLARDADGGAAASVQLVTVQDTTPPKFQDFPKYAKFLTDSPKKIPVEFDLPRATDLADIDVQVFSSHKPGSKFPVGNTTVTFTATDDSGNSVSMDVVVVVIDTSPKIQNVVVTPHHDRIVVSWDHLANYTKYKAVLTEVATGENVANHKANSNTQIFTNLEPGTEYWISISAFEDKNTKVTVKGSTLVVAIVTDDFTTGSEWELWSRLEKSPHPQHVPFDDYQFTIDPTEGRPAPSAKIHGDGYKSWSWIQRTFDTTHIENDLFLQVDYRAESLSSHSGITNAFVIVSDEHHQEISRTFVVRGGVTDSGWGTLTKNIGGLLNGTDSITVKLGLYDTWAWNYGQVAYFDNFYLGAVPPPSTGTFRGGSSEPMPVTPEQEILDQIFRGEDPYKYVDGIRMDDPHNDLVDKLLFPHNSTIPN